MYGRRPYTHHLTKVVEVLERHGINNPYLIAAGWLHDVIEDTDASYNDVKKATNEVVAELVFAVTDELGRNRKERAAKTYPKIAGNIGATVLKLADRIANIENGNVEGGHQFQMYRKEYRHFREVLHVGPSQSGNVAVLNETWLGESADLHISKMWEHLDRMLKPQKE